MSKVQVKYSSRFNPSSGSMCQLSWAALKPELEKAFAKKPFEVLLGLEVTELGIKAVFGTQVQPEKKSKKKSR